MKKLLLYGSLPFILACVAGNLRAQSSCTQTLLAARSTYDQGRLHELPGLLEGCLKHGFTQQEREEAYKLLTLAYIYLEEPFKADQAMIHLLKTNHFLEATAVDPAEFVALYNTFRTEPIFQLGLKIGPNSTQPSLQRVYYAWGNSPQNGQYTSQVNIQMGLTFEKRLSTNLKKKFLSKLTAAPEILYSNSGYAYANKKLTLADDTQESFSQIEATFKQSWLDLNLLTRYRFVKSKFNPYVSFGPGINYLLNSSGQFQTLFENGSVVTGPAIDITPNSRQLNLSLVGGAGIKYKFGDIYLTADVQYKFGLMATAHPSQRQNYEALLDYGYVQNDFTLRQMMMNIGFVYPIFNPKKLSVKK